MTEPVAPREAPRASTRERILDAARSLLVEASDRTPSVRVIAARAGVGASTLRHHFPTQRALFDAALEQVYVEAMPDARIADSSIAPDLRLVECLEALLAPVGTGAQARGVWENLFRLFVGAEAGAEARHAYPALVARARERVVSWLVQLEREGALAPGDHVRRADLLLTVVDGLSIARALPDDPGRPAGVVERAVLADAVNAVLRA